MGAPLWILLGLAALVLGAELVVRYGARLARSWGVPPILIGLTIVSIGTSAPELAVGIDAIRTDAGALAVGNIVGTNAVNLLLILGLSAAIRPLMLHVQTIRVDLPAMALAAGLLMLLSLDAELSILDGVVLLLAAVVYTAVVVTYSKRQSALLEAEYAAEYPPELPRHRVTAAIGRLALVIAGIAIVVVGADWLVRGSVELARELGVADSLIGLTVIAIGTSAPELATTMVSTFRGDRDIAVGNLLGSSTYNLTAILGGSLLFATEPVGLDADLLWFGLPVVVAVSLVCVPVFTTGRQVSRLEGSLFVVAYLAYLGFLIATA